MPVHHSSHASLYPALILAGFKVLVCSERRRGDEIWSISGGDLLNGCCSLEGCVDFCFPLFSLEGTPCSEG